MTGAAIAIDDTTAVDTILSVKQRVFAANRQLPVHRQRLVYRPGPHGINPLADDETLGGAGVARDGTAELDVLLEPMTGEEAATLDRNVWFSSHCEWRRFYFADVSKVNSLFSFCRFIFSTFFIYPHLLKILLINKNPPTLFTAN